MPEIRPFDAWRYDKSTGKPDTLCCPPYDVISEARRRDLEALNPRNAIRLEKPESYESAKNLLGEWKRGGVLKRFGEAYYVYEMGFVSNGKAYTLRGFTGRCRLTRFGEGDVLPHELTLSKAKADRLALMNATAMNFSPVYTLYEDAEHVVPNILSAATEGLEFDEFVVDGVTHRLWSVTDGETIRRITEFFKGRPVFIADGHHRYETACNYRDEHPNDPNANYVMMTFVDMENDGLVVLPTHRVLHDADLSKIGALLTKESLNGSLYYQGRRYDVPIESVDDLHTRILEPYFGIGAAQLAAQSNIVYTRDEAEALRLVDEGAQCAFILPPTRVAQIAEVAKAGGKMPQKSTYFHPKLITGLYFNDLS
ncbi:phosphatase [Clostridia bacterium]|nr:phosphatase [Clostridia bacterium]